MNTTFRLFLSVIILGSFFSLPLAAEPVGTCKPKSDSDDKATPHLTREGRNIDSATGGEKKHRD